MLKTISRILRGNLNVKIQNSPPSTSPHEPPKSNLYIIHWKANKNAFLRYKLCSLQGGPAVHNN